MYCRSRASIRRRHLGAFARCHLSNQLVWRGKSHLSWVSLAGGHVLLVLRVGRVLRVIGVEPKSSVTMTSNIAPRELGSQPGKFRSASHSPLPLDHDALTLYVAKLPTLEKGGSPRDRLERTPTLAAPAAAPAPQQRAAQTGSQRECPRARSAAWDLGGGRLARSLADEVAVLMCEAEAAIGARSDILPEVKAAPGVSAVSWLLFVSRRAARCRAGIAPMSRRTVCRASTALPHISQDARGQAPGGRPGPTYYPRDARANVTRQSECTRRP
jgi:hypothetical protein